MDHDQAFSVSGRCALRAVGLAAEDDFALGQLAVRYLEHLARVLRVAEHFGLAQWLTAQSVRAFAEPADIPELMDVLGFYAERLLALAEDFGYHRGVA